MWGGMRGSPGPIHQPWRPFCIALSPYCWRLLETRENPAVSLFLLLLLLYTPLLLSLSLSLFNPSSVRLPCPLARWPYRWGELDGTVLVWFWLTFSINLTEPSSPAICYLSHRAKQLLFNPYKRHTWVKLGKLVCKSKISPVQLHKLLVCFWQIFKSLKVRLNFFCKYFNIASLLFDPIFCLCDFKSQYRVLFKHR